MNAPPLLLIDFEKYIAQIGAAAFYSTNKPMEVTGKFQLTAWLYQFVSEGMGELYYESRVGELCTPQKHIVEGKGILSFNIGIGR